jgi:hypothetical protein
MQVITQTLSLHTSTAELQIDVNLSPVAYLKIVQVSNEVSVRTFAKGTCNNLPCMKVFQTTLHRYVSHYIYCESMIIFLETGEWTIAPTNTGK